MTPKDYQFLQTKSISELKLMKNKDRNPVLIRYYDEIIQMKKDQNRAKYNL